MMITKSMNLRVSLLIAMVIFSGAIGTAAQRKKPIVKKPVPAATPAKPVAVKPLETEFPTTTDKLQPGFLGHNALEIYAKLKLRVEEQKKGEFETTEAYNIRMSKEGERPLLGSVKIDSTIAFVAKVDGDTYAGIRNKYDADKNVMTYVLPAIASEDYDYRDEPGRCFNVGESVHESSYGDLVKSSVSNAPYVRIENWHPKSWEEIDVALATDRALGAKDNSSVLFIGKLAAPYTSKGYRSREASYNSSRPTNWITNLLYVNLDLEEVWIFNDKTGEIYAKVKRSPAAKKTPPKTPGRLDSVGQKLDTVREYLDYGWDKAAWELLEKISRGSDFIRTPERIEMAKIYYGSGRVKDAKFQLGYLPTYDSEAIEGHKMLVKLYLETRDCDSANRFIASALVFSPKRPELLALQEEIKKCGTQ